MGLSLTRANLASRAVRQTITGEGLTRKLNLSPKLQSNQKDGSAGEEEGFFQTILSFGRRFFGFLSSIIRPLVQISATAIFGTVLKVSTTIATFDWAASDNEIQQRINGNNVAIAGVWGSAIGSGAGWLAGIAIGYGVTVICPVIGSAKLARLVAGEVSLEALEELTATTKGAIQTTFETVSSNLLLSGYRSIRKFFGFNPPDSAPSWTIAEKFEERIESIKDPTLRAFTEGFFDEFFDSFVEAGYIFAYELDSQLASARAAQAGGVERVVKLIPDKESPKEAIVLAGAESQLKTAIQNTLIQHRLIYNRDVGQIVGQPAEDWYKAKTQRRKLTIVFNEIERPPYRRDNGRRPRTATYSIPDPKPGLSWEKIKFAAKAYTWGRFRATANLDSGRQMAVYGASPSEAEDKLKDLLTLSTAEISTLSITEEKERNPALKKEATRFYPANATYLVRRPSTDTTGRNDLSGDRYLQNLIRFRLWTDEEPEEFDDVKASFSDDD